jgi:hypothetical protein
MVFMKHSVVHAQSIDAVWGAGNVGRAGAVTADTIDVWSTAVNPALGAAFTHIATGVAAALVAGPAEPARVALVAIVPFSTLQFITAVASNGLPQFRESMWTIGVATHAAPAIAIGARLNMHSLAIDRYGASSALTIDCGTRIAFAPEWAFGAAVENLLGPGLGALGTELRRAVRLGMELEPAPSVIVTVDAVARQDALGSFCIGTRIQIHEYVSLCAGMNTEPSFLSTGIEINAAPLLVSYAYRARPELGAFHVVSVGVSF